MSDATEMMVWILTTAGCKEEAALLDKLGTRTRLMADAVSQLYQRVTLEGVAQLAEGLKADGRIGDKNLREIRALWQEVQAGLEGLASQPIGSLTPRVRDNIYALHLFGVVVLSGRETIAFFVHPGISAANLLRMTRLEPKAAAKHIQQIASVLGEGLSAHEALELYDFHVRELCERMRASLVDVAREWSRPSRGMRVELLPTSTDFYAAGIQHYRTRPARRQPFTIFATTPGLFLPEERHGPAFFRNSLGREDLASQIAANDAREPYFNALVHGAKGRPRIYHFDLERSRAHYDRIVAQLSGREQEIYDRHALELIRPLLSDRNFGIVGVERLPSEFEHLTLGNGSSVVVSARHGGTIGRGMWVRSASESAVRSALQELDLKGAAVGAFTATTAYILAGGGNRPVLGPELERIALTLFYAPIIYVLLRGAMWRPNTARSAFEDFTARLRAHPMDVQAVAIKRIGDRGPTRPVTSIHDLLTTA